MTECDSQMANTYSQITIQVIFVVKRRECLLKKEIRENLYRYITGIIKNENQKLLAIGGVSDHIHLLIGLKPDKKISELVKEIKANSSRWINENHLINERFEWQSGYAVFSYTNSQQRVLIDYILNQETHHKEKTFREEYVKVLNEFNVEYEEKYLFEQVE